MAKAKAEKKTVRSAARDIYLAIEAQAKIEAIGPLNFRRFLEHPDLGRPYLTARSPDPLGNLLSDDAWAIVDAIDGNGNGLPAEQTKRLFGCNPDKLPTRANIREVDLSMGGRGGKTSTFLAPYCVYAAWTVPIPNNAKGERAVAAIMAPKKRTARQAFSMVVGLIEESPILSKAIVKKNLSEIVLRRPDGKEVTIEIIVAKPGGLDGRGFALVFVGIDEAAYMPCEGAIVDADVINAMRTRLVPVAEGENPAIIMNVSTPHVEGMGYFMKALDDNYGNHTHALVAARVSTHWLNPWWDVDGKIEAALRARKPDGEEIADREISAIPLPRGAKSVFNADKLRACLRLFAPDYMHVKAGAGGDLAFAHDSSALAIALQFPNGMFAIPKGGFLQWHPTADKRLVPSAICGEMAVVTKDFGAPDIWADSHYAETLREHTDEHGIGLVVVPNQGDKEQVYIAAAEVVYGLRLALGALNVDDEEGYNAGEDLVEQMLSVTRRPGPKGRVIISAPRRKLGDDGSGSAGHADAVSALVLALRAAGAGVGTVRALSLDDYDLTTDRDDDDPDGLPGPRGAEGAGVGRMYRSAGGYVD
jgi:hypothetical protein